MNKTVITYRTESGDKGVLGIFEEKPSKEMVENLLREQMPYEYECGCPVHFEYNIAKVY